MDLQSREIVEHSSRRGRVDILLLLRQGMMNCFNRGCTKSSRSARRPQCPYLGAVFFLTGHDRDRGGVAPTERLAKSVWVGVRLGSSVFDMVLLVNSSSQLGVDIKTRCPFLSMSP